LLAERATDRATERERKAQRYGRATERAQRSPPDKTAKTPSASLVGDRPTSWALTGLLKPHVAGLHPGGVDAAAVALGVMGGLLPFLQFGKIINPPKEGLLMARELRCADLMPGCNFVAQGKDDSEVMKKAAEHAKSVHKMAAISMDVEKKARAAIRDAGA